MLTGIKTTRNSGNLYFIQSATPVDCVEVEFILLDTKLQIPVVLKPRQALSM